MMPGRMPNALRSALPSASLIRIAETHCRDACVLAQRRNRSVTVANPQVNAHIMRNRCVRIMLQRCKPAGQTRGMQAYMRRVMPRARDERTNERYGRTYRSPRDHVLALSDAHVRVHPGLLASRMVTA